MRVERSAGDGAGFADDDYTRVGAALVDSVDEVFERAHGALPLLSPKLARARICAAGQLAVAG